MLTQSLQALYFCQPFRKQVLEYHHNDDEPENMLSALADAFCTNVLFQEKVWSDTDTEIHIEIEEGEWYLKPSNLLNSLLINFSL